MQTARVLRSTSTWWLALALATALPLPAAADLAGPALGVVSASADPELQPIARGYDRWLAAQLAAAGISVISLGADLDTARSEASQQHLTRILAPRLASSAGRASVHLPLLAPESGALLGGARAEETLGEIGKACAASLDALLVELAAPPSGATPAPLLDDLASASRAVVAWDAGDWVGAWREVEARLSPTAMALREAIVEASRGGDGPPIQRARVLVASGDPLSAARLIGRDAAAALHDAAADPALLVAGGELALARSDVREALEFFDAALARSASDPGATLGRARTLALQGDASGARDALLRMAQLAPSDPQPWMLLAESEQDDPRSAARHLLEAGRRSAAQLEVQRARHQVEQATRLDASLAGEASATTGQLEERLGRPAEALAAYRRAAASGVRTPTLLVATGRTQRALGQTDAARASLEAALAQAPQDPSALSELGALHLASGDAAQALPLLRDAHAADATDPIICHRYAEALSASGQPDAAAQLLEAPGAGPEDLRLAARIRSERGDLGAAKDALARALRVDPLDVSLHRQNAEVLTALGDREAAGAELQLVAGLEGERPRPGAAAEDAIGALTLDELVTSFAAQVPRASERRVALLDVREPGDLHTWMWRLVRPRGPDLAAIRSTLQTAIEARFGRADPNAASGSDALQIHIDRLFTFEKQGSLDAQTIAAVNQVLASDGIFLARVLASATSGPAQQCEPGDLAIELRLLSGRDPELVSALANVDCLRGGLEAYGAWNWIAFALYALAALAVGWPLIRGWGSIRVDIVLPERTKGFFSIHVTRRADAVKKERVDKKSGRKKMKAGKLDFLKRFERHMAGRETLFRLIPARKQPYTVTVAGPLLDARGEEIIGHFLEEQRVAVGRGTTSKLVFDFCPRECAVEVRILVSGRPAAKGRVAVEGDPSSLRYAREGTAYLYLGAGRYTILAGCADAAASIPLEIESVKSAIPLQIDFEHGEGVVFRNCPQAVDPYLQSDLASAAAALEAHGQPDAAHRVKATLYRRQGRHEEAAREFEAGGRLGDAAEILASGSDFARSAQLFLQAGEFARAAEAYRSARAFAEAADCYERAYDYARAIECWREAGDPERELLLQEKLGEYLEAARLAREQGDADRALALLGHIDPRHSEFALACRQIAEIASERGDFELAVAKLEQAIGDGGPDDASDEVLEAYASALERAARQTQALSIYELLRRRDASRSDVATHIQRLRRTLAESGAATESAPRTAARPESRYELLEELGRGGMGVVYKARDRRLGRIVALKRLPENLKNHPQAVALFEREARAAAALGHRNIVTLFDAGQEDGTYFISMELLEGRPLNAILTRSGRLRAGDVLRLGVQICAGLHFAHERRIVHRDIKCANLFFTNERVVKIMDFGIAKSLEEVRRQATVIGGTPYYMAPEQAAGEAVDHRADLYALGVTFFQLATGSLPFADGDVSYRHRHEAPPDPRQLVPDLPERLARLILASMAKRPEERPASAAAVGEELRALLSEVSRPAAG
jgi:tetratricopeptide (TPR) repeat protein